MGESGRAMQSSLHIHLKSENPVSKASFGKNVKQVIANGVPTKWETKVGRHIHMYGICIQLGEGAWGRVGGLGWGQLGCVGACWGGWVAIFNVDGWRRLLFTTD